MLLVDLHRILRTRALALSWKLISSARKSPSEHEYALLYKHIFRTSAVSSTILGQYSSLQAALSVLVVYYVGEFSLGGVLFYKKYVV